FLPELMEQLCRSVDIGAVPLTVNVEGIPDNIRAVFGDTAQVLVVFALFLFQHAIFYAQLITSGRRSGVHRFLESRAELLLALCDRAPDGILIGCALGGEAN